MKISRHRRDLHPPPQIRPPTAASSPPRLKSERRPPQGPCAASSSALPAIVVPVRLRLVLVWLRHGRHRRSVPSSAAASSHAVLLVDKAPSVEPSRALARRVVPSCCPLLWPEATIRLLSPALARGTIRLRSFTSNGSSTIKAAPVSPSELREDHRTCRSLHYKCLTYCLQDESTCAKIL